MCFHDYLEIAICWSNTVILGFNALEREMVSGSSHQVLTMRGWRYGNGPGRWGMICCKFLSYFMENSSWIFVSQLEWECSNIFISTWSKEHHHYSNSQPKISKTKTITEDHITWKTDFLRKQFLCSALHLPGSWAKLKHTFRQNKASKVFTKHNFFPNQSFIVT